MVTGKEILSLLIALVVMAFSNSFLDVDVFLYSLLFFAIILLVYVAAKKFMSYYFESETEERIWSFQIYGFAPSQYFKKPVPIGIIFPFILSIISLGYIKWFALTETEIKPTVARAARRHDFYSYSELTEWHVGLIPAFGIICVLIVSFIAYLVNVPELARLAIYFSFFNMLPIGKLDGGKIFFGSLILYFTLLVVVLIALGYALLLV